MSEVGVPLYITETGVPDAKDVLRTEMFTSYFAQVLLIPMSPRQRCGVLCLVTSLCVQRGSVSHLKELLLGLCSQPLVYGRLCVYRTISLTCRWTLTLTLQGMCLNSNVRGLDLRQE